ncbi:hypothetical protein B0H10DRAFT_2186120 [Mycena sp. CBHHK59/15]|nr:hypothetical protein B0H10DRAFT_2201099 [Mycena sp. CBHHK59/15]KAJ6606848.1 hypothetical protein B0H10DRAFT_2195206 [Mycena sp. CBHHK59/15]KAJ6609227.1 hypothetical protein B0H10DRAFT_1954769 [Mycena sp. CBHHK59/15]KAJ6625498.1 hypothetical protein B0H10DRAFT_2186120 [Mycena sp. CBHHK59/15]
MDMIRRCQEAATNCETLPEQARDTLTKAISITRDEESRLLGTSQLDGETQSTNSGRKRQPSSPAGTPRRSRILKTSAQRVVAVARQETQETISSSSTLQRDPMLWVSFASHRTSERSVREQLASVSLRREG